MKYFDKNLKENTIGMNNIEAGNMKLLFHDNNIQQIRCFDQIESNHIDINTQSNRKNMQHALYLDGFMLKNK